MRFLVTVRYVPELDRTEWTLVELSADESVQGLKRLLEACMAHVSGTRVCRGENCSYFKLFKRRHFGAEGGGDASSPVFEYLDLDRTGCALILC